MFANSRPAQVKPSPGRTGVTRVVGLWAGLIEVSAAGGGSGVGVCRHGNSTLSGFPSWRLSSWNRKPPHRPPPHRATGETNGTNTARPSGGCKWHALKDRTAFPSAQRVPHSLKPKTMRFLESHDGLGIVSTRAFALVAANLDFDKHGMQPACDPMGSSSMCVSLLIVKTVMLYHCSFYEAASGVSHVLSRTWSAFAWRAAFADLADRSCLAHPFILQLVQLVQLVHQGIRKKPCPTCSPLG